MARLTAIDMRTEAREAMLAAGGRGFMRFLPEGRALLATDALRRCDGENSKAALIGALEHAGFSCCEREGLLTLMPDDKLLDGIVCDKAEIDWTSPLHRAQALGALWRRKQKRPLTGDGRQLIVEALRLSWQTVKPAENGLDALRARAAMMMRRGDDSGFYEAGAVLLEWCCAQQGGDEHED